MDRTYKDDCYALFDIVERIKDRIKKPNPRIGLIAYTGRLAIRVSVDQVSAQYEIPLSDLTSTRADPLEFAIEQIGRQFDRHFCPAGGGHIIEDSLLSEVAMCSKCGKVIW